MEMIRFLVIMLNCAVRGLKRQDVALPLKALGVGLMGLRFVSQESGNGGGLSVGPYISSFNQISWQPSSIFTCQQVLLASG